MSREDREVSEEYQLDITRGLGEEVDDREKRYLEGNRAVAVRR